ncbi:MAG: ATP-binding cassette domain-containing protein [Chloroflexi bacterium]|nr:MAG: ATP-binding cassette domain-containing protein [Chloroflexota bacterium]
MIEADGLTKQYGQFTAIQDVNFTCKQGEVVGFLGPNGAGKTTTMRILTGYMPPTHGNAYIAGHHTIHQTMEARQRLGYLPETVPLYPEMRVEDYLAFMGQIRRVDNLWDRIDAVLEDVGLLDRAESFIGNLSKGMRQRVGLAQALLHDPDVLILDEPTIGLDPAQIVEIRQLITELGKKHTVLLSTHILAEVEQICTRVIMIIDGRIWADMPMEEIRQGGNILQVKLANPTPDTLSVLSQVPGVTDAHQITGNEFNLTVDGRDETRIQVAETAVNNHWGLLELTQARVSLETIFLNKLKEAEAAYTTEQLMEELDEAVAEEE